MAKISSSTCLTTSRLATRTATAATPGSPRLAPAEAMEPRQPCSNWLTNRIKLVVAYDGTDFRGWAAQAGLRTVQGTLTETVRRVSGEDVEIVGASRTDSGAHARGQVCHFDTQVPI